MAVFTAHIKLGYIMSEQTIDEQLEAAKAENTELFKRAQLEQFREANQAARHVIREAWGDVVDRTQFLRDTPGWFWSGANKLSMPHNRKHGDFYPFFRTEQELQRIRGDAQYLSVWHPVATGLIDDLANYTVSTGYTYAMAHKPNSNLSDQVLMQCQEVVDEFNLRVDNEALECSFEREIFKRSVESGETFVGIQHMGDGYAELLYAEPEWIVEPKNVGPVQQHIGVENDLNWKYGIATTPGRPSKVHGYSVMWNGEPERWEYRTPEDLIHIKLNTPPNVKRGLPDFYGVTNHVLEQQAGLMMKVGKGAAIQASIALIREHAPGTRGADVQRLIAGQKDTTVDLPAIGGNMGAGNTVRQKKIRAYEEGTVLDVVGSKYHPGPMGTPQGPSFVEIGQALVRIAIAKWSYPEHMAGNAISGAGGARSAIVEMGTPFAKRTVTRQMMYGKQYKKILWQVLKLAFFHGRITARSFVDLQQMLEIKATPPDATQRNMAEAHMIGAGRHQARFWSMRTWRENSGIDHEIEEQRVAQEDEENLQKQLQQAEVQHQVGMQQQADQMGLAANAQNEALQKQEQGQPGQGEVGRQNFQGGGSDTRIQDRSLGVRNPMQAVRQRLAAARAGKNTRTLGVE